MQACAITATLLLLDHPFSIPQKKYCLQSGLWHEWESWTPMLRTSDESGFLKCIFSALSKNLGKLLRVGTSEHEAVQANGQILTSYTSFGKVMWWGSVISHCWSSRDPWHTISRLKHGQHRHCLGILHQPQCSTALLTPQPTKLVQGKSSLVWFQGERR